MSLSISVHTLEATFGDIGRWIVVVMTWLLHRMYLMISFISGLGYAERVALWNKVNHIGCNIPLKLQFDCLLWPFSGHQRPQNRM